MNVKQRQVFTELRKWCLDKVAGKSVDPFNLFLTGGAGTGKSHIIKAFHYEARRLLIPLTENPDDITVLLVAYTGTAAFNIGGQTIHSAFNVRVNTGRMKSSTKYDMLGEDLLTALRAKYKHLHIIIIDEVSMVGKKMLCTITQRLVQITRTNASFGNVSILAVGDFYQIPPVGDAALYKSDRGELCESPWSTFEKWNLTEVMRQKDDLQYARLLNRLRTRRKEEAMDPEDDQLLLTRCTPPENIPPDILHIFPRNAEVGRHNEKMLHKMNQEIIMIDAADVAVISGDKQQRKTPASQANTMLQSHLEIAKDARVMLTTNLNVADGFSNGVLGTVVDIIQGKQPLNQPESIIVKFDNDNVGKNLRQQNPGRLGKDVVIIKPHTEQFRYQGSSITRHQYPLKLAWACTIHKTQGMTLDSAAISLKHTFLAGMAYVALSRVSSLSGLYLIDYDKQDVYCEPHVMEVMTNMQCADMKMMPLLIPIRDNTKITIVSQNVHSIQKHLCDIKCHPELMQADILVFSESWLSVNESNAILVIEGFKPPMRCDRPSGSGRGGIILYLKETVLQYTMYSIPKVPGIESIMIEADGLMVVGVYRSPTTLCSTLNAHLDDILGAVSPEIPVVVCGDFNIDIASKPHDIQISALNTFKQMINDTTFGYGLHRSLLDHIYIRNCRATRSGVLSTYFSDHDPTYIQLQ